MPLTVLDRIRADFPTIRFRQGDAFAWMPEQRTIIHPPLGSDDAVRQLLHELGHAELAHDHYQRDIQLIDMERDAWLYAVQSLAPRYGLELQMTDAIVQQSLDSYRQWLHDRASCPTCHAVGLETARQRYRCLQCNESWRVNEARTCQLRRYKQPTPH